MGSLKSSGGEDARSVPILFLDIDGVLNRTATAPQINLEQDKVDRLKGVLETSGADIVLTTYWRCFEVHRIRADEMGAPGDRVVGRTPGEPHLMDSVKHDDNVKYARIMEIETYLTHRFGEDRSRWPKFAVVDDKQVVPAGHDWSDRFVKTEPESGLTDERAGALATALNLEPAEVAAA